MVRVVVIVLLVFGAAAAGCWRGGDDASETSGPTAGSEEAMERVRLAARALAERDPTVDYVAAQMKGVIKGRTSSQALIHYDGYRATFTTPGDRVMRIEFDFVETKPTLGQFTAQFGAPEENPKGWLYRYDVRATGAKLRILAEPVTMPATEDTLVRRLLLEKFH